MKNLIKSTICALAFAATLGLAGKANALTILTTDASDPYLLGWIVDGVPPGANELGWVDQLRTLPVNAANVPSTNPTGEALFRSANNFGSLPQPTTADKHDVGNVSDWTIASGNLYLLGKYGTPGSTSGQISYVWYIGTLTGDVTIGGPTGLSHSTMMSDGTRVADGGATVMLLGMGLTALAFVNRKLR